MDSRGKKIEVNASSLIDLKAELFRKQEEFRKAKLLKGTTSRPTPAIKKPNIWGKQNKGILERCQRDIEAKVEEEDVMVESRKALEAKTKLYEKLSQDGLNDDEESKQYLVNFQKKAVDDILKIKEEKEKEEKELENNAEEFLASKPEDEWVDYVDLVGKSRRCLRKDLPELIEQERKSSKNRIEDPEKQRFESEVHLAEDLRREQQRLQWEKEEEEARNKPVGPIHYQNVRYKEVRNLGVGYFGFSTDEEERQQQMDLLNNLRNQTIDQREKRLKFKEKRKELLQARLAKVKQRRNQKLGITVEEKQDEAPSEDEEAESLSTELAAAAEQKLAEEKQKEEIRSQKIRPWDIGKLGVKSQEHPVIKKRILSQEEWIEKQREERTNEFAPPQFYYDAPSSVSYPSPKAPSSVAYTPPRTASSESYPPTSVAYPPTNAPSYVSYPPPNNPNSIPYPPSSVPSYIPYPPPHPPSSVSYPPPEQLNSQNNFNDFQHTNHEQPNQQQSNFPCFDEESIQANEERIEKEIATFIATQRASVNQ